MSLFGRKPLPKMPWEEKAPEIDADKRYDVYCRLHPDTTVIYRGVKFKGKRSIPGGGRFGLTDTFLVIEQMDGSELYVSAMHIFLFCEHGVDPGMEQI